MSSAPRGRHRAARHAAPKKKVVSGKHLGALVGVAGMSSVVATSGSTVAGVIQTGDTSVLQYPQSTLNASNSQTSTSSIQDTESRAQAASRSDDRQTLSEAELMAAAGLGDPSVDPNAQIDATPTVSNAERKSLQSLAASADQYSDLFDQAQAQKTQQAQLLISEQEAAKQAAAAAEEQAAAALAEAERIRQIGVVVEPIQGKYQLSARYGQRGGIWSSGWHTGLDFRVKSGTSIVAAANGTIIDAGWAGAYGYRIEIDHGNGTITTYNHLSKITKSSGKIAAGQEIGKSGSTGNTTGPHLHFEVTQDGEFTNPSKWLWGN
jgi:murein DD-endopeptidase MepM/ murein hydrolase activator NlpD